MSRGKGIGAYDGVILGAAVGALIAFPEVTTKLRDMILNILPESIMVLGDYSFPIFAIVAGALIGWLVDKT